MSTMLAALYYGAGDVRLEQLARPVPAAGEALVRVRYCGICGSDLRSYLKAPPPGKFPLPRVLGHEFSGTVAALGAEVSGFELGDRVAVGPATSCGGCFYCRKGAPTLCLNAQDYGTSQPGAFAEYVLVPARLVSQGGLVSIPDQLSDQQAALIEPLGTCFHGMVTRGHLQPGETVAVIGDGTIGLIQVMLAKHLGAGTVICAGHHDDRLEYARRFGAQITINTYREDLMEAVHGATEGMGADLVMISVPNPRAFAEAIPLARGDGRIVIFGGVPKGSTTELDSNTVHYSELTITGSFNCSVQEFRQATALASELPLAELVTHRVPLARIVDGFELMAAKSGLKVLVEMQNPQSSP
jgi:L-iditol 2-dehydrogenase